MLLLPTASLAQQVPTSFNLVDASGQLLGRIVDVRNIIASSSILVTNELNGQPVVFDALNGSLLSSGTNQADRVYFESIDCSGQGYTYWEQTTPFAPLVFVGLAPDFVAYLGSVEDTPTSITYNSQLNGSDHCAPVTGPVNSAYPVSPIAFTRVGPFRVENAETFAPNALAVPAADRWGLGALALLLAGAAVWRLTRRAQAPASLS